MTGPVLCLACGMEVLLLENGICPSCGAHGQLARRVWYGRPIQALVPTRAEEPDTHPQYACLYLRPFATRFRAAGRMQAVARAMQSFGSTVALHANEEFLGLKPVEPGPILKIVTRIPRVGLIVALPLIVWNWGIALQVFALRGLFRWHRLELVDVTDDRWRARFRQLALHSRLIVMDVSARSDGVSYEAEFIADLDLSGRLVLLHNDTPLARGAARQQVDQFKAAGVHVPLVPYSIWTLRRLTRELEAVAKSRLEAVTIGHAAV